MTVILSNSFEGLSDSTVITNGNSGGTSGNAFDVVAGSPKAATAAALNGSMGMSSDQASTSTVDCTWNTSYTGSWSTYYVRDYFSIASKPPSVTRLSQSNSATTTALFGIAIDSVSGKIGVRNLSSGTFTSALSASAVPLNTRHRYEFEAVYSGSAYTVTLNLFYGANADGTTPDETLTSSAMTCAIAVNINYGTLSTPSQSWTGIKHDSVAISDAPIGPIVVTDSGTGSVAMKKMGLSGAGTSDWVATGSDAIKKMGLAGSGTVSWNATGSVAMKKMGLTVAGVEKLSATGSVAMNKMGFAGSGTSDWVATGSVAMKKMGFAGSGTVDWAATGSVAMKKMGFAGSGTSDWVATGSVAMNKMGLSGTGTVGASSDAGTGSLAMKKMGLTGSGTVEPSDTGTGSVKMKKMGLSGVGWVTDIILGLPKDTCYFGAYPGASNTDPGASYNGATAGFEGSQMANRALGCYYRYWQLSDLPTHPNSDDVSLVAAGRILVISITTSFTIPPATGGITYSAVTAGTYDTDLTDLAANINNLSTPAIVTFGHEAELSLNSGYGTPAQFIAAFQHVMTVLQTNAPGKVIPAWVTSSWTTFGGDLPTADYYPGDAHVKVIGFDPYDMTASKGSPDATYSGAITWLNGDPLAVGGGAGSGGGHGKALGIFETGLSGVNNSGGTVSDSVEAAWVNLVPSQLKPLVTTWGSRFQLWMWFNSQTTKLAPSSLTSAALASIGTDPYFNPGALTPTGTGSAAMKKMGLAGSGTVTSPTDSGTGSVAMKKMGITGISLPAITGTGSVGIRKFSISATDRPPAIFTGSVSLRKMGFSGTGVELVSGSGSVSLRKMGITTFSSSQLFVFAPL